MISRGVVDADRGVSWVVSERAAAVFVLCLLAAALSCRWFDAGHASTAALKTITATLAVGLAPGVLLTLLWRPRPTSILEVAGFGIAISFGFTQLLTILAVSAHLSPVVILTILLLVSVLAGGRVIQRATGTIAVSADELIVLAFAFALSWSMYTAGSPVDWSEDQIHVAIARRLSQLDSPRLDNLYVTPGIVYTYPFPGTHYFMGLIARAGRYRYVVSVPQAPLLLGVDGSTHAPPGRARRVRAARSGICSIGDSGGAGLERRLCDGFLHGLGPFGSL